MNSNWINHLPAFVHRNLDGRHNLQKLIVNTSWLFADKILRMGVGLVVGIWIARYLGPQQFGLLSYAIAFVTLFSALATLGLDGIVVRDLVRSPEHKNEILGATFMFKLIGSGLALVVTVTAILLLRPADSVVHWLVAIIAAGTIFQSFDAIDFWFQARVESRSVVVAKNSAFLIVAAIKIFLILNDAPLLAFAYAGTLEAMLGALGLVIAYRVNGQHVLAWTTNSHRIRQLIRDGWPLALAGMTVVIYMKIDQIMLGEMLGNQAVGIYSAAVRISEVWYFIPLSIVASVTPSLIEAKRISTDLYYQRLARLFRLMTILALAIAIPMTFASSYVATALYGNEYEGAGPVLAIHIWAALFVFLGVAQSVWTVNEGLTKLALVRTLVGATVNVLLNLLLIPRYGPVGAAIATTVSYGLSAFILNAFSRRTRRIFALQLNSIIGIMPRTR